MSGCFGQPPQTSLVPPARSASVHPLQAKAPHLKGEKERERGRGSKRESEREREERGREKERGRGEAQRPPNAAAQPPHFLGGCVPEPVLVLERVPRVARVLHRAAVERTCMEHGVCARVAEEPRRGPKGRRGCVSPSAGQSSCGGPFPTFAGAKQHLRSHV
jgi:hypothetical protein